MVLCRHVILSCADSLWAVKLHWLDKFLLYTVTDKNMAFLVHNYCWATDRNNGKSITADVTDNICHTQKTKVVQFWKLII
jgi:hypothetical protein